MEQHDWVETRTQWLSQRTAAYPEAFQSLVEVSYVQNVLKKLPLLPEVQANFSGFQARVETMLDTLPPVEGAKYNSFSRYMQELNTFKNFIRDTYQLVPKGYYKKKWLLIGIVLGVFYWLIFKNGVVGILLGLVIGMLVGGNKDKKAEQENRVL